MEKIALRIGMSAIAIFVILIVSVFYAIPVWWLWNWIVPEIFGLSKITIAQAFGLTCLCGILVKGTVQVSNSDK